MYDLEAIADKAVLSSQGAAEGGTTPDKSRYYDLRERPELAGHLPPMGRYRKYGGTVVPGVVPGDSGKSLALDVEKPRELLVEGGLPGSHMLMLKDFTDEEVVEARNMVTRRGLTDPTAAGVAVCQILAAMREQREEKLRLAKAAAARPAPRVSSTKEGDPMRTYEPSLIRELQAGTKPALAPPPAPARKPLVKVEIELPGGGGEHVARYADVLVQDDLLVLVHDHSRADVQHVWFPKVSDLVLEEMASQGSNAQDLRGGIRVFDAAGNPVVGYLVFFTNRVFRHGDCEYAMLTISQTVHFDRPEPALNDASGY